MNHLALAAVLVPLSLLSQQAPPRQPVAATQVAPTGLPPFQQAANGANSLYLRFVDPVIVGDAGAPGYLRDHAVSDYVLNAVSDNGTQSQMGPMRVSGLFLRGLPELSARCAALQELRVVELYSVTPDDEVQNKFTLRDVRIVHVTSGISATSSFESHLSLDFGQVDWEYRFPDRNGQLGAPQRGSFTNP